MCIFQLKGSINDCSCNVDTVDYFNNNRITPRLKSLLVKDYFRFYKVNLRKDCPFWNDDDSKCAMRFCSVHPCEEKDIPEGLKGQYKMEKPYFKVKIREFCREIKNRSNNFNRHVPVIILLFNP